MAVYERRMQVGVQETDARRRPDFAAISRRIVKRDREALAILDAHDRAEFPRAEAGTTLRRAS